MTAHSKGAKRPRQNEKHRLRNKAVRTTVRSAVKRVVEAIGGKDVEAAVKALKLAISKLDHAYSKGVMTRGTTARTISRLSRQLAKIAKPSKA